MIVILRLDVVALWAVFSKFELVRWGWLSGTGSQPIVENEITPAGMFSQSGFQTIKGHARRYRFR